MGPWGPLAQRGVFVRSSELRKPCAGASGQSGWATCVHQGATVPGRRTLAGAKVRVWRVHRAQRNPITVPLRVQRSVPRAPFGHAKPIAGLSFGHHGQSGPACSFGQDESRSRAPFAVFGITGDKWVPEVCRQPDPGLSDPARTGRSGQPSISGRTFE